MKRAVKIRIQGTVQGVFFRNFIKEQADILKLKGYVRNRTDGEVEIFVEGTSDGVREFIEACKSGPPHSIIKKLDIVESKFEGLEDFKIVRI